MIMLKLEMDCVNGIILVDDFWSSTNVIHSNILSYLKDDFSGVYGFNVTVSDIISIIDNGYSVNNVELSYAIIRYIPTKSEIIPLFVNISKESAEVILPKVAETLFGENKIIPMINGVMFPQCPKCEWDMIKSGDNTYSCSECNTVATVVDVLALKEE